MPLEISYVSTHIHTDGPIPGPHSLLTLASAAYSSDGDLVSTFTENLRELPRATLHPASLAEWRPRAVDWVTTRRLSKPPALVTNAYINWVASLPGEPVFVTDLESPNLLFCYWYLQRFSGEWPFARTVTEAEVPFRTSAANACVLASCWESQLAEIG